MVAMVFGLFTLQRDKNVFCSALCNLESKVSEKDNKEDIVAILNQNVDQRGEEESMCSSLPMLTERESVCCKELRFM